MQTVPLLAGSVVECCATGPKGSGTAGLCLAAGTGEDLKLSDIKALVSDYKRLALAGPHPALASQAAGIGGSEAVGRFLHLQAGDLRLGDLRPLLQAYRTLLPAR